MFERQVLFFSALSSDEPRGPSRFPSSLPLPSTTPQRNRRAPALPTAPEPLSGTTSGPEGSGLVGGDSLWGEETVVEVGTVAPGGSPRVSATIPARSTPGLPSAAIALPCTLTRVGCACAEKTSPNWSKPEPTAPQPRFPTGTAADDHVRLHLSSPRAPAKRHELRTNHSNTTLASVENERTIVRVGAELTEKPYSAGVRGTQAANCACLTGSEAQGRACTHAQKMKPCSTAHVAGVGFSARQCSACVVTGQTPGAVRRK